jgi:hypothetical protein
MTSFEFLVRGVQDDARGRLVDLARLDADEAVLDHVDAAHAVRAGDGLEALDQLEQRHLHTVGADRHPALEIDLDVGGRVGQPRPRLGERVDVLGRLASTGPRARRRQSTDPRGWCPRCRGCRRWPARRCCGPGVGEDLGASCPTERPGAMTSSSDRAPAADTSIRSWSLPLPAPPWAMALAPSILAIWTRRRAMSGRPRPSRAGTVLVHRPGLERGQDEVVSELLAHVDRRGSARRRRRARARVRRRARALSEVERERDDLRLELLGEPADGNRRVEAARVAEHDAFHVSRKAPMLLTLELLWNPLRTSREFASPPAVNCGRGRRVSGRGPRP